MKSEEFIIDAADSVLGRLASFAAKQALLGNKVFILNCDKAVILGNKANIIEDYRRKTSRGDIKGPFFPKTPARIVKRAVRGMLAYKKGRGLMAYKRVLCYGATPLKYTDSKKITIAVKKRIKSLKVKELNSN
ncbi:MAG: 50S ribosomal protein L13 [archaeon]